MKVHLLGTGAADGWPAPFCRCTSCEHARRTGNGRQRSGVIIDDVIVIDPSPDVTSACARFGVALDQVSTILIGHGHPDHLDPSLLLAWCWQRERTPLRVLAPRSALDLAAPWIDPELISSGAIEFVEAILGDDVILPSGHRVRALPAEHGLGANGWPSATDVTEAVLWEVCSDDGYVLLYAADTGPLPDTTIDMMRPMDVLLLEETFGDVLDHGTAHLDLATFPDMVNKLRARGAVTDNTEVVAVHLSHFNPPDHQLRQQLAQWGARPGFDGELINATPKPRALHTLITGGARSGKSREAEQRLAQHPDVTYLATAPRNPDDPEWEDRLRRHQDRRPSSWTTIETHDIASVLATATEDQAVLIDCLTLWLTRIIDEVDGWRDHGRAHDAVGRRTDELLRALRTCRAEVVFVTNEVGWGIVPVDSGTRMFRDLLGELNATVASACDEVVLVVAGQVVPLRAVQKHAGEGALP